MLLSSPGCGPSRRTRKDCCKAFALEPLLQLDHDIVLIPEALVSGLVARLDDECAVKPERLLPVGVIVRVVHERPGLAHGVLVGVGVARLDRFLRDLRGAVHPVRDDEPVPVHRR